MMVPIYLFWNYVSPFPWWLGPILQIAGILLLWSTRHTFRLYPKFGRGYYLFSAIARPIGIILIAWGWLEIFSVQPDFYLPKIFRDELAFLTGPFLIGFILFILADRFLQNFAVFLLLLSIVALFAWGFLTENVTGAQIFLPRAALVLSLAFAVWSIFSLGLRRSFLYGRIDDPLVTRGAYKYFRHPQLLAAIFVTLTSILILSRGYPDRSYVSFQLLNALVMILGLYLISIGEDKDLGKRFGPDFLALKAKVPGFLSLKMRGTIKWHKSMGIVFCAYLLSFFAIAPSFSGKRNTMIFTEQPFQLVDRSYHFGGKFLERIAQQTAGKLGEARKNLEIPEDSYGSILSRYKCPVTVFMCGKSQTFSEISKDSKNPRRRLQPFRAVTTLPFDLECSDQKIELAATYNCDYDEFAHIVVVVVNADDNGKTWPRHVTAADDSKNNFAPEFIPRLKQKSNPK